LKLNSKQLIIEWKTIFFL